MGNIWLICVIWVILTINRMDCMDMVGISWEYFWDMMGYAFGDVSINHQNWMVDGWLMDGI